jgi:hypothetical protein
MSELSGQKRSLRQKTGDVAKKVWNWMMGNGMTPWDLVKSAIGTSPLIGLVAGGLLVAGLALSFAVGAAGQVQI